MDFIPAKAYADVYYNGMLGIMLLTFMNTSQFYQYKVLPKTSKLFGNALLCLVVLFIGLRPVSKVFEDMLGYAEDFIKFSKGARIANTKDIFFQYYIKISSQIMDLSSFFVVCAFFYIVPMYYACRRIFKDYFFWPFFLHITAFSFWAYGTNGIRNGMATSLILLGISLDKKYKWVIPCFLLAFAIHASSIIPIAAYVLTLFHKNTKHYLLGWLVCIGLSAVLGNYFSGLIANLGFDDQRAQSYLTSSAEQFKSKFSASGFRVDFLVYSAIGIAAGYYFIFVKKFTDPLYVRMYNIYVIANAFWILVIRVAFSNRFAYLSWFMIAMIIAYPLFKAKIWHDQYKKVALIVFGYFSFTYLMTIIK